MIQEFPIWSAAVTESNTFAELSNTTIAVDASWYLGRLLFEPPAKEPLLSALGGIPFSFKSYVLRDLEKFRKYDIKPIFVFHGLKAGSPYKPFEPSTEIAQKNAEAWELYNQHQAESAVDAFGKSGYAQAENYYRILQQMLNEAHVSFMVAPYRAWAQMAYMSSLGDEYIDAVAGSSELLLFPIERLITFLDFETDQFQFVRRESCLQDIAAPDNDSFVDAAMLAGNDFLPTLPQLRDDRRQHKLRQAYTLIKGAGYTGLSVCLNAQDDPAMKQLDYLDRYCKSRLAVKHHVVMQNDGSIKSFDAGNMPNDSHEFLGPRLPDELHYYLQIGVIGARVINQLAAASVFVTEPADGGDSAEYRALVQTKLLPLRAVTLALLSKPLTRAYQFREVRVVCWFDQTNETSIKLNEVAAPDSILKNWHVRQSTLDESPRLAASKFPSILSLVEPLADSTFSSKTIGRKSTGSLISTTLEITTNAFWRFLHIRGYVDDEHRLTSWGKVLHTMLNGIKGGSQPEEAAFLAAELLRHGLLTSENYFPTYSGYPANGSDTDKRHILLVSRVACLGKFEHQSIGFTGPLCRNLLGYNAMINTVRESLRDLLEVSLATLLLFGDADRQKAMPHLTDIALSLPFALPTDCGLGVAVSHYLEQLADFPDPTAAATKEAVKEKGPTTYFPYSLNFLDSLSDAFMIWDAVYAGVKLAGQEGLSKDLTQWDAANSWVKSRR